VVVEVGEVLEVGIAEEGVEVLVGEGERHGVEDVLPGEDAAPGGALGADAGDVGPDDVRAPVAQQLRQEARAAPGLEETLAGFDPTRDHAQAVEVDLALGQLGPVAAPPLPPPPTPPPPPT